jgi:hypothetical protein
MNPLRYAFLVLGVPLLAGGCAGAAVTAVSYGADGASYVGTGKSVTDHLMSIVTKKDCSLFRAFGSQSVCRPRPEGDDPYHVDYDSAERMPSEDGVSYAPPLRAAPDAPPSSWTAAAYTSKPVVPPAAPSEPAAATHEAVPQPLTVEPVGSPRASGPGAEIHSTETHSPETHSPKTHSPKPPRVRKKGTAPADGQAHARPVRAASPNRVAAAP